LVSDVGGAIAAFSMLVAVVIGGGGAAIGVASNRPALAFFGGGVVFGALLGMAFMRVASARRAASVEHQRGYRWVRATYTYTVSRDDWHFHHQDVEIEIQAIRHGVRTFSNQYSWTGSGDEEGPIVTSQGHTVLAPPRRALGWRSYDVTFNPALRKGQTTTITLVQVLHDTGEKFEPFLAKTVLETMGELVLRVDLPRELRPRQVWHIVRVGTGPEAHEVDVTEVPLSPNGAGSTIEWVIPKPIPGHNYELSWAYDGPGGIYDRAARTADSLPVIERPTD
jgi:hypothetical protein